MRCRASPQLNATHHIRCERTVVQHCTNKHAKKQTSVKTVRSAKVAEIKLVGSLQQHLYKAIGSELIISSTHPYIKQWHWMAYNVLMCRKKLLTHTSSTRYYYFLIFSITSRLWYRRFTECIVSNNFFSCLYRIYSWVLLSAMSYWFFLLSSLVHFLPERRYCQIKRVFLYSSCVQRHLCLVEQLQTRWLQLAACHLFYVGYALPYRAVSIARTIYRRRLQVTFVKRYYDEPTALPFAARRTWKERQRKKTYCGKLGIHGDHPRR